MRPCLTIHDLVVPGRVAGSSMEASSSSAPNTFSCAAFSRGRTKKSDAGTTRSPSTRASDTRFLPRCRRCGSGVSLRSQRPRPERRTGIRWVAPRSWYSVRGCPPAKSGPRRSTAATAATGLPTKRTGLLNLGCTPCRRRDQRGTGSPEEGTARNAIFTIRLFLAHGLASQKAVRSHGRRSEPVS